MVPMEKSCSSVWLQISQANIHKVLLHSKGHFGSGCNPHIYINDIKTLSSIEAVLYLDSV